MRDPVAPIVFATSLLPTVPSQTSPANKLGSNNLVSGGNNSSLCCALSDVSIGVGLDNQYRPSIQYNPTAEYRLVDMSSSTNLNKVGVSLFREGVWGQMRPLEQLPRCSAPREAHAPQEGA